MDVKKLDHFTINVRDLQTTVNFYEEVLGLRNGDRPPFDFPGAWLYCGDSPVVHLVAGDNPAHEATGAIDHVAFRSWGLSELKGRLDERGLSYEERKVPDWPLRQIFVKDPDGVLIEMNFWDEGQGFG